MNFSSRVAFNAPCVTAAIIVKLALAAAVLCAFNGFRFGSNFRLLEAGDTPGYLTPADNLVTRGVWLLDPADSRTSSYRTPAYGLIYLPFRLFAGKRTAEFLLVGLQLIVSALAAIAFANTVMLISGSEGLSWAETINCRPT